MKKNRRKTNDISKSLDTFGLVQLMCKKSQTPEQKELYDKQIQEAIDEIPLLYEKMCEEAKKFVKCWFMFSPFEHNMYRIMSCEGGCVFIFCINVDTYKKEMTFSFRELSVFEWNKDLIINDISIDDIPGIPLEVKTKINEFDNKYSEIIN